MDESQINIGLLPAISPGGDESSMIEFVGQLIDDLAGQLDASTGVGWHLHLESAARLATDDPRRPSDYLDEASLRMAEGPYDAVVIITDVGLVSRRQRAVPGLASPVSHVAVISTRKLVATSRGQPPRSLTSETVRNNAATLLLHLTGHLLGLEHTADDSAMQPFSVDEHRVAIAGFADAVRLKRAAARFPDREYHDRSWLQTLGFHALVAVRHPVLVLSSLLRNRAPLLPLALPGLATAAVAPTLLLMTSLWALRASRLGAVFAVWLSWSLSPEGRGGQEQFQRQLLIARQEQIDAEKIHEQPYRTYTLGNRRGLHPQLRSRPRTAIHQPRIRMPAECFGPGRARGNHDFPLRSGSGRSLPRDGCGTPDQALAIQ